MQHFISELIDLLLVLVAAWMVLAIIFVIHAYFVNNFFSLNSSNGN